MEFRKATAVVLISAAAMMTIATGCGGGSSKSSSSQPESTSTPTSTDTSTSKNTPTSGGSSSEPSAEFAGKGANGKFAKFGKEASAAEREAASSVLEENLQAREAGDWAGQCASLTAALTKEIEKVSTVLGASPGCAKALAAQAKPAPKSARANPMTGPIDALRVGGTHGFALFHGTGGKDYVIPLEKENGKWKVASLTTQEVP